mgnify:FL=1|tara:strand:- start:2046 stop:2750 length:705 start_codon:yes stop_codon:yes gene_type:complete
MGYLDNTSITVDAVLTKKGREILKDGGSLNITSFTLSDTGVDYTLWNPDHPSGSAFYGEAIENLPMLEASVHAEYNLRNRLVSLNQNTIAVPALVLGNLDTAGGTVLTFNEGDENSGTINVELVGYSSNQTIGDNGFPYYFVIQDPSIISTNASLMNGLSGTSRQFLQEQDIPFAQQYGFNGTSFQITPIQQDIVGKSTNVYVVHVETGAYNSFTVTNNITKNQRAVLSTGGAG